MRITPLMAIALTMPAVTACGPSQTEIEDTVTITCNIFRASRNMDAPLRLKEINVARKKIGAQAYLGTDKTIKEAVRSGLCEALVRGDDIYEAELSKMMRSPEYVAPEVLQQQADEARNRDRKLAQVALQALLDKQTAAEEDVGGTVSKDIAYRASVIASEGDTFYRQQNFNAAEERYKRALDLLEKNTEQ